MIKRVLLFALLCTSVTLLPTIEEVEMSDDLYASLREVQDNSKVVISALLSKQYRLYLGVFKETNTEKVHYYRFDAVGDFTFFPADPKDPLQVYYQDKID